MDPQRTGGHERGSLEPARRLAVPNEDDLAILAELAQLAAAAHLLMSQGTDLSRLAGWGDE
jgi:hypothetical protein